MANETKKADGVAVLKVKVGGLAGKRVLRLTECGAAPLANGATLLVQSDLAAKLAADHPDFLTLDGTSELKAWPPGKTFEVVSDGGSSPVATEKASGKTQVAKPANKNMAAAAVQTKSTSV